MLGHKKNYYDGQWRDLLRGSELFAELTSSLLVGPNKLFYNTMKKIAPKSVEIYHELMEDFLNE